jgi:hypothetical protein
LQATGVDIQIKDNLIADRSHPIALINPSNTTYAGASNIVVRGNTIKNALYGVEIKENVIGDIYIENNIIDGDKYYQDSRRSPDGSWDGTGAQDRPSGVYLFAVKGVIVNGNVFKNVMKSITTLEGASYAWFTPNYAYGSFVTTGAPGTTNKGIYNPGYPPAGIVMIEHDTDLASASFGETRAAGYMGRGAGNQPPTVGQFVPGSFAPTAGSSTFTPSANGNVLLGYVRVTKPNAGDVVGVDWLPLYVKTTDT